MNVIKYNSKFIKSFDTKNVRADIGKDGLAYHYTSPEAFLSIIKNNRIRFTDIRYLNDKSETLYFVKSLIDFIEKKREEYPVFFEIINFLLVDDWTSIKDLKINRIHYNEDTIIQFKSDRAFIFCASLEPDALNMWNYYVKNGLYQGYNLGINIANFLKTFDTETSDKLDSFIVYYGEVLYEKNKQFDEIEELAKELNKTDISDSLSLLNAALHLRSYIELQGLFYKSPKFKNEKEYRVLISIANDRIPRKQGDAQKFFGVNNRKMIEEYYAKNGLIVPALSVVLPQDALSRVYISPITEFEIAKASTKELLETNGFRIDNKSVSVYKSKIPIRF